jgi:tRNA (guanine37-N1)-methyltransferase
MVLKAKPFLETINKILDKIGKKNRYQIIYFSPRGKIFNTEMAKKIADEYSKQNKKKNLFSMVDNFLRSGKFFQSSDYNIILVSGKYEGIDSRVQEIFPGEEISVGEFVLTGGELPAMILIDSISRQISGVLGNFNSREEERISSGKFYTRPEVLS